ncbi:hypothetical protein EBL89_18275 [Cereibacter sphaeroides]|uniref:hypothetical protein n=1 Tax=Cereibacter sphaeroides TaxID=1063 RepID=UPI000F544DF7|nr:hypothetical protein [Cereibacter sphaeroides]AZB57239.1 hypothetical protein EBL89_18275 [Cereibacter sphaeroides]AZB61523.1 hypothetical protein EBL88_18385 [Cereibacter sphaeroides]
MNGPLDIARASWGDDLPDWIETLAIECGKTSQNKVAGLLDRSPTVISQLLRRKYPGNLPGLEERVRGVFQSAVVRCPALGTMPAHVCQDWRAKGAEFQTGNPLRVRMYRACRTCPRAAAKAVREETQ